MIANRLSTISSNEDMFNESLAEYNAALKKSGYKEEVKYKKKETTVTKRASKNNTVWYIIQRLNHRQPRKAIPDPHRQAFPRRKT